MQRRTFVASALVAGTTLAGTGAMFVQAEHATPTSEGEGMTQTDMQSATPRSTACRCTTKSTAPGSRWC